MAKLYKRNKVYWFQFRGRRVSTRCTDRKAAELAAREFERRAADPLHRTASEATLDTCFKAFKALQLSRGRAPETIKMNLLHAGHFLRVLGRHTPLDLIEATSVDRYIEVRQGEDASQSTIQKELSTLRGALRHAGRRDEYRRDLLKVMPQGFSTEYRPRDTALTLQQVGLLLGKLEPERAARVAWIVATGSRLSESDSALAEDVGESVILLRGTKTAGSYRKVPRIALFEPLLKRALPHLPFAPWSNVRRDLEVACRRAKVTRVTPNDLRRSCATILRLAGVEPSLLAVMLGHRDTRMVERVYGRVAAEDLGRLIAQRTGTKTVQAQRKTRKAS
jgi:integrase